MANRRPRKMLVADLLCGAGGSTTGAVRAMRQLGLDMEIVCLNHSPVAIATHSLNHPEARHYIEDIATVRPHIIVPEGYLDLLMASPTCTHHSNARGGKPTSDQQRSDPWHIITWLTELRVKRLIIENVWEFVGWGPVDARTGRPIKSRKGEYFHAWIDTIKRLGFDPEWRKLNAADYGDATTRQRFILMARSDGRQVRWPTPTHTKMTANLSLLPAVLPWKPAYKIIDWKIKGVSIFKRKKPLAPKTLLRIYAGALKYNWPEPFIVVLRNHMTAQSIHTPIPTIAARGQHIALVQPIILSQHSGGAARSPNDPLPTITTGGAGSGKRQGCARPILVEPQTIISPYYGSGSGETCVSADAPLPTITAKGRFGMVVPITHADGSQRSRDVETDPIPTLTTAHRGELALVNAVCDGPIVDVLFRMFEPHELAAAMGFSDDEATYEFTGTKTEQIKQIGNAVSVAKMKACVLALMADAAPKKADGVIDLNEVAA
jgi:DNA (cytosine-5)-methyltransferase 1